MLFILFLFHLNNDFRAIFDNDEYVDFKKKLEDRIKHHDKDIERLCNVYYQGFIESVRELLDVRTQSKKLNVCEIFFNISDLNLHLCELL